MDVAKDSSQFDVLSVLSHTSLFTGVALSEQKLLASKSVIVNYGPDEIVIDQGDIMDRMYVIVKGMVLVTVKSQSKGWVRVNTLGAGDVFGEIAILHDILRTARVTTLIPCQFLTISAKDFMSVYQYFPARARDNIQIVIAKRMQELGVFLRL